MTLQIGDTAPDFEAQTTEGPVRFHEWIGDSWAVLFSHPKDFTPVCTTELGYMAKIKPDFDLRGVKVIGLSVDSVGDHERWAADIAETQGQAPNYPIIADDGFAVAKLAAQGRSNKEIARTLHITVSTVEAHLSRAYAKLGVRSHSQLAGRLSSSSGPAAD